MKKVWAVSSGTYSGYGVHAMFATKKAAKQHAKAINGDGSGYDAFVESFPFYADRQPEQLTSFSVWAKLRDTGDVEGGQVDQHHQWEYEESHEAGSLSERPTVTVKYYPPNPDDPTFLANHAVRVVGSDSDAVAKTFSDLVAQWRASGYRLYQADRYDWITRSWNGVVVSRHANGS